MYMCIVVLAYLEWIARGGVKEKSIIALFISDAGLKSNHEKYF
jgi:hypothetical protein